jgi:uncharacterized protein (TIGR00297 family)
MAPMSPEAGQGWQSLSAAAAARLLTGSAVNLILAFVAWRAGTIRPSGIAAGVAVGLGIFLAGGWPWFCVLAAFFVVGSFLTKLGYSRKAARGLAEADRGRRGWPHALANGGVGALCALAFLWTGDARLPAAFVAAFATAIFDTAGSEIGGWLGRTPVSLRTFRIVPPGTGGAVSLEGTLGALVTAALLAAVGALAGVIGVSQAGIVLFAAVLGGLYESVAAGRLPLGHMALNFTNTLVGAAVAFLLTGL